jgi:hypothetical protein
MYHKYLWKEVRIERRKKGRKEGREEGKEERERRRQHNHKKNQSFFSDLHGRIPEEQNDHII